MSDLLSTLKVEPIRFDMQFLAAIQGIPFEMEMLTEHGSDDTAVIQPTRPAPAHTCLAASRAELLQLKRAADLHDRSIALLKEQLFDESIPTGLAVTLLGHHRKSRAELQERIGATLTDIVARIIEACTASVPHARDAVRPPRSTMPIESPAVRPLGDGPTPRSLRPARVPPVSAAPGWPMDRPVPGVAMPQRQAQVIPWPYPTRRSGPRD